ncbi:Alpha-L-fucosidase [Novipirellula aureliae]|uniref:alpha-L-fucosidase n=1 Tax=Novipirellula aureliae TaxID=2527966 RepID=A0A5C6DD26_9BACT|nr:alpha-L-fucosidase [Novipirellula aureliae]TWU34598.1 Alpha-L-fucosidase [Novipirellula aureliae]
MIEKSLRERTRYLFLLCGACALPLFHATAAVPNAVPTQRVNSCVVMDASEGKVEGSHYRWDFDLTIPGRYVVQLIGPVSNADGDAKVRVTVDGNSFSDSLKKVYMIEDGIVWQTTKAIDLKSGTHHLLVQSELGPTTVRLASEAYEKSRIHTSSNKYYEPWLKMHLSAEKQAALARHKQNRFGMFIHWGAYSVAGGSWKGTRIEQSRIAGPRVAEWLMFTFNISRAEYREFAKRFNPDKSFAENVAKLAKDTGMKYVVITAKHHDGFALFDSTCSDFDVVDACPYDGDLIKELYDACRAEGLDFGVYYSHGRDWADGADANYTNVKKNRDALGVPTRPNGKNLWDPSPNPYKDYLQNKAYPQVEELIKLMPELSLIWFDGEDLITEDQAFRFYKMIYDLNPNIIVNRRIGYDFGDYVDAGDNKTPDGSDLAAKHFETCGTGNHSWGYKAHDNNWRSSNQLLRNFVDIVSKGGNYLLNIGPDGEGRVQEPCVKNFQEMGDWVKTNSEAIFGTTRWTIFSEGVSKVQSDSSLSTEFWFSAKDDTVYAMSLAPAEGRVQIHALNESAGQVSQVRLLDGNQNLPWTQNAEALEIDFGSVATGPNGYAVAVTIK